MVSNVSRFSTGCLASLELMHNQSVHGANGYLITQFLDNTSNHRTDQWGGSVENCSHFGLEVLKVLKEAFGHNVAVKLSPAGGYNDVGYASRVLLTTSNIADLLRI